VIHSNKSQNHRFKSVEDFENGNCRILIATDIVARGIDVEGVSHVINFAIPELAENYIHRIGRTGRAEAKGNSIAFSTEDELKLVENIEQLMNTKIKLVNFPESVEVSEELIPDEVPVYKMKNTLVQHKIDPEAGGAFHDKKDKNKKVNMKVRKAEKMRMKYKKPKTRGQKKRRK
jgi:ATP-dependent RNA helicase RhlE